MGSDVVSDVSFALEMTAEEISDVLAVVAITFTFDSRASDCLFGQYQKSDNYVLKWVRIYSESYSPLKTSQAIVSGDLGSSFV